MLRCITSYFNVNNSTRVKENFIEFRKKFIAPLTVVELAFDDQPFWIDDSIRIRGNSSNLMWQKERLINIGIQSLPSKVDKIAWVDADIIFEDNDWFKKTEAKLDYVKACQLFSHVYEINSNNDPVNNGHGYIFKQSVSTTHSLLNNYKPVDPGKYGLAWAANRSAIPNGLHDFSIVGNSDIYQLLSWQGAWNSYYYDLLSPKNRLENLSRGFNEFINVTNDLGHIRGIIRHLEHGTLSNRKYIEKQKILSKHDFSIDEDIQLDQNQLWEWNCNKPELKKEVKDMFFSRNEDT